MSNSEDLRLYIASLKENTNTETAMIYTKSEIREAKKRIAHELKQINNYLPVQESNWLPWHMVLSSLKALEWVLKPLKTHIIDNDDYALAVEINKMITPVWYDYCKNAKDDVSLQHQLAYEVQDIIKDLRDWIGEYEAEHPELGRPIAPAITVPEENDVIRKPHYIVNKEVLNVLPVIYAFLVKESVINGDIVTFTDYFIAIENADISKIYPNSVKSKFKTTIKAIQKCFTKDWFSEICKSAGIPEDSMGKSNFGNSTAKEQWFRKLNNIVTI